MLFSTLVVETGLKYLILVSLFINHKSSFWTQACNLETKSSKERLNVKKTNLLFTVTESIQEFLNYGKNCLNFRPKKSLFE